MTPGWRLRLATLFVVVATAACTSPPDKELHQAEGAIETARAAGAPRYAPQAFQAAEQALQRATAAVADRDYKLALNHALDARERAVDAVREAAESRARIRGDVEQRIADLESLRKAFDAKIAEADTAKVARPVLAAARTTSDAAARAVTDVRALLTSGDDDKALELLKAWPDRLATAGSEIDAAVAERNSRRPARRARR